ncbi:MAG: hypothetical protein M3Y08_01150 [Fibrobacterota bacterium]|nr:hypothetical protein [Fibrobacterota bacterium]
MAIYANHLSKRLTAEQFAKACIHVIDNFRPTAACRFPTPAHFVEYATGSTEERATNAVSRVMAASRTVGPNTSVSFGDKALHRTVERFGGWEEMRDFDWQFREVNFKKVYAAEVNAGDNFGPDYLEGCHEKTNRLTQHTWIKGTPRPLLIAHVGEQGEPVRHLPPPTRDIPREIEQPGRAEVGEIMRNLGIGT